MLDWGMVESSKAAMVPHRQRTDTMTAGSLLADALVAAAADFDGDAADAHISIQLHEDRHDGFEWWSVAISENFDSDMTRWLDGADAAHDLALIRGGKAAEVAERYDWSWDDEWTEFHGDASDDEDEAA